VFVRVCVAIRETTTQQAINSAARAAQWADLVEFRADYIRDLDVKCLLRRKPCPVLFTLRSSREGGEYRGSEKNRLETILEAASCGADYVDVEYSSFWRVVADAVGSEKVVLSHHDFQNTPANLIPLVDEMAATGAAVLKIAVLARSLADNRSVAAALEHATSRNLQLCALAMGAPGIPSRVLGGVWGSWATFASLPGAEPTADGQIPADELVDLYRVRDLNRDTAVYAVVGHPLGHSFSPLVHNRAFAVRQANAVYVPLDARDVEDFVEFDRAFPVQGASVTIPYKEELRRRAFSLSIEADRVGAANTLVRKERGWHAENSDVEGFLRPLRRKMHPARLRAVVLGAGGAARAVVYALCSNGATVQVVARDPGKARQLASVFQTGHAPWQDLAGLKWDLLVNTTPVGMYPNEDESPVPPEVLTGGWVYDLVYNPAETKLLRDAAGRGCRTISGIEMFAAQAVKQQYVWMGPPVPEEAMNEALRSALGLRRCDRGPARGAE
jgi:3-dehydroquinate dehydratase/shikimate dehydrogenase